MSEDQPSKIEELNKYVIEILKTVSDILEDTPFKNLRAKIDRLRVDIESTGNLDMSLVGELLDHAIGIAQLEAAKDMLLKPKQKPYKGILSKRTPLFLMDENKHYWKDCHCKSFGKKCPECGGFMHYQPVHGGYYYKCEKCLKETD